MAKMILINLPVKDIQRSIDFYKALGFTHNVEFSNEFGAAMLWDENIWVWLLTHDNFKMFVGGREISDSQVEVLNALTFDSKAAVDKFVAAAVENGGTLLPLVVISKGMYNREIADPDGHLWEAGYMELGE